MTDPSNPAVDRAADTPAAPQVLVDDSDRGVRSIRWNRPDALNAMTIEMWHGTRDALDGAEAAGARAVLFSGAGRAFNVGQDLGEFADPRHAEPDGGFRGLMRALADCPLPLVAAVDGMAVGFGFTLLPWCEVVLVSPAARFKAPFVSLGVTTEAASCASLPATIGAQAAAWHLLSGDWLGAHEAVARGLALRVVEDGVVDEARALAEQLAAQPPVALRSTLELVRAQRRRGWAEAVEAEYEVMARLAGGEENIAAISGFFDR